MQTWQIAGLAFTGLAIGLISGMLGIGGGVLLIPALVLIFGFDQKLAVGTSLAMMLPPVGAFAVMQYYRSGQVNLAAAGLLAVGFAIGAWGGSQLLQYIPEQVLRYLFCAFLIFVVGNLLFRSDQRVWAALTALSLAAAYALGFVFLRMIGKTWDRPPSVQESYRKKLAEPVALDYEI